MPRIAKPRSPSGAPHERESYRSLVADVLRSSGRPLDSTVTRTAPALAGFDLSRVRIHDDERSADAADAMNARAFAVGSHIGFAEGELDLQSQRGQRLLFHELAHVARAPSSAPPLDVVRSEASEQHADGFARSLELGTPGAMPAPPAIEVPGIHLHPADKVLRRAGRWLLRRTAQGISKHIARHTRMILGRAVHTVFRNPRRLRALLERTIREAGEAAKRNASRAANETIEEAGIRISRQRYASGKVRWIIQKEFRRAIGTQGERIMYMVIDQSGRLVTAFPIDRLMAIGLAATTINLVGSQTAEAAEGMRREGERYQRAIEKSEEMTWTEFIPIIGDLYGGSLNAGEEEILSAMRFSESAVEDIIASIEDDAQRTLSDEERATVRELVRAGMAVQAEILPEEED